MTLWLDAHISPALASWIANEFGIDCVAVRDLGLREARDRPIFAAARDASADLLTKDEDFAELVQQLGSPPRVLWLRSGNTSNATLRQILTRELPAALERFAAGESLVELGGESE